MKTHVVTENCRVILDGEPYELEVNDRIVMSEGAIIRKVLKVGDGDGARYFIASSASDNWLIKFVKRLCDQYGCADNVNVVSSIPRGRRPRPLRTFLDEIAPVEPAEPADISER